MAIKRISVSNFKGFASLDIQFGNFNVLVGANASGKTSIVQVFKFLRDAALYDLVNAISMQGGHKYLRNMRMTPSSEFRVEVVTDQAANFRFRAQRKETVLERVFVRASSTEFVHTLTLNFKSHGKRFEIKEDKLHIKARFNIIGDPRQHGIDLGIGSITVVREKDRPKVTIELPVNENLKSEDLALPLYPLEGEKLTLGQTVAFGLPLYYVGGIGTANSGGFFGNIGIYDFDPKLSKKAVQITGKAELNEDGSNLALILKGVLEEREKKRKLSNLLRDLLPFIEDLGIESFSDKSLLLRMRETNLKKEYLPASLISDGTISIAALIVALYFERKDIVLLEEPERNIHPFLIGKVLSMMGDASRARQILLTTHSPEIVKHAGLENLLLLARDDEGFCTIKRPADSQEVQVFLQNEIGVEELYAQNLL